MLVDVLIIGILVSVRIIKLWNKLLNCLNALQLWVAFTASIRVRCQHNERMRNVRSHLSVFVPGFVEWCRAVGAEMSMDWIHPWIALDWTGLDWVRWLLCTFFDFQPWKMLLITITLLLFYFSLLTNIDYEQEQSSTMSWLDLAINMQQ